MWGDTFVIRNNFDFCSSISVAYRTLNKLLAVYLYRVGQKVSLVIIIIIIIIIIIHL